MENKINLAEILKSGYLLLDGAMGTMLQKNGLKTGALPEEFNLTKPDLIKEIATEYANAGAKVLSTNTFGANAHKMKGLNVKQIITTAISLTKSVAEKHNCLTALDIGPIGEMLAPIGSLSFENAYELFKEQILSCDGADLITIETMTDLQEMRAAVLAAKENCNLPIFCTMTFEKPEDNLSPRTFLGVSPKEMAIVLTGLGVSAIGVNCSLAPSELAPIIKELAQYTSLPIIAKPNAGLPNLNSDNYDLNAEDFAKDMKLLLDLGVQIVGGCCGTTPEYIKALADLLSSLEYKPRTLPALFTAVCSSSDTVIIDGVKIIGERLNPTGKKVLKEALRSGDTDYLLRTALEQVNSGADILDVNVGLPDIDEQAVMKNVVLSLQSFIKKPLQIDSSDKNVIESALRIYNGKAIVNSVNGEDSVLNEILPIVKKYGACVVGLTLDKNGIPKTAEERFNIAKHIMLKALSFGIKPCDVIIDCLTLTASAEQEGVNETLDAISMVKEKLHLKTVLGVSNISFGLPCREIINSSFLTLAMEHGLDLAIINPNIISMTNSIFTFNLLKNRDQNCMNYIAYCEKNSDKILCVSQSVSKKSTENTTENNCDISAEATLKKAVENGLKDDVAKLTSALLQNNDSMTIVNEVLIPALDVVGEKFASGKLFLPQLILSAQAVESAFDVIKQSIKSTPSNKGKIILATVKGDIHDIGKNIVKVLLQNYGYTVIDLGKDVEPELILEAIKTHNVKLVGLSALMTTTVKNMEITIKAIKQNFTDVQIVVGGAVLTADYAKKIGADFYAKDAKESVDVAKKVFA